VSAGLRSAVDWNCSPDSLGKACRCECILYRSLTGRLVIGFRIVHEIGKELFLLPGQCDRLSGVAAGVTYGGAANRARDADSVNP